MLGSAVFTIQVLLLTAAIVAIVARRFRVPYTIGLVLAGIAIARLPIPLHVTLTRDLIFTTFLPPLVFEAALHLRWQALRDNAVVVVVLASLGTLLSALLTAAGMHWMAGWDWTTAALFGILIAATDPVSVIATFRETGIRGRLRLLMEAESLLNDGTAAVGFVIVLAIATGGTVSSVDIAGRLLLMVGGGIACGLGVAALALLVAGRSKDPLLEIMLTCVAAYGSFLVAEHFHCSGVLATVAAGLLVGNAGPAGSISGRGHEAVISFWDFAAFVINSLIFILIGLAEAHQEFVGLLAVIVTAIVGVTLGRAAAIYPLAALLGLHRRWRIPPAHQHVLFWGGLRGALALALVLGLPETLPHRGELIAVAFAVVAFSIIVQGITMRPLLRHLGELPRP